MSLIFTVFLPNKTRYKLEISKFTPLYQGLEKVCTEKGYLPAQSFIFRYNKTYPDLGTPVGMLSLSNLSELELVPASEAPGGQKGASSDSASVCLQFESQRHIETCQCDCSLWDMIGEFSQKHPGWIPGQPPQADQQHPVLVYMRQEVPGEFALRGTSLRQLGLPPGSSATLRLLYRPVPPDRLEAARRQVEARSLVVAAATPPAVAAAAAAPAPAAGAKPSDAPPAAFPTPPAAPTHHSSSMSSSADLSSDANLFSPFRTVPREVEQPPAQRAVREPRTLAEALNLPSFESPSPSVASQQQLAVGSQASSMAFGPGQPFKFPEETAGQNLYRNELSDVQTQEFAPCDRRVSAYVAGVSADAAAATASPAATDLEEPDDSFFDLTESDMRILMADLKRKVEDETNAPLLTRQQREQRREDAYSGYEYSVIRLFFPDRRVVQAAFRPRETVFTLYKFVRCELLRDSEAEFFLYTTPPKREISDMAQFLIHADLVPMPIVYVGFRSPLPEGQAILKAEILAAVSDRHNCDRIALACMKSTVEPIYNRQQQQQQQQQQQHQVSSVGVKRAANTVPKWFKK